MEHQQIPPDNVTTEFRLTMIENKLAAFLDAYEPMLIEKIKRRKEEAASRAHIIAITVKGAGIVAAVVFTAVFASIIIAVGLQIGKYFGRVLGNE